MISSNLAEDGFLPSDSSHHRSFHDLARPYNTSLNALNHTGFPPPSHPANNYIYQSMVQSAAVPRSSSSSHHSPTKSAAARRNSPPILPPPADVNGAAVLYRSVSADSAALPQSVGNHHLVQRLAQQNALIREAWEAERNYLEANRRRAEEVYQEERVIMEEVREGWENEKAAMLREMQVLKERIQRLEGENHTLKAVAAQSVQITGVVSPRESLRAASVDTSNASAVSAPAGFSGHVGLPGQSQQSLSRQPQSLQSQAQQPLSPQALAALARHSLSHPSGPQQSLSQQQQQQRTLGHLDLAQQPRHLSLGGQQPVLNSVLSQSIHHHQQPLPAEADPFTLPPGLDGASRRPHFAKPGSSRTSPTGQPESSPFIPLDPRMQPQTSHAKDFLNSSTDESDSPVPVIDVQEVDPKLEGIPLKATAVQKYTFGANESANGSPAVSPPAVTNQKLAEKPRPHAIKRLSSKDNTFQVLQAEESRRLTMHAGHTPNHSLSLFPTMSIAASSTGAPQDDDDTSGQASISGLASASGQASAPALDAPDAPAEANEETERAAEKSLDHGKAKAGLIDGPDDDGPSDDLDLGLPEEVMEPEDDVKLKGPLMIKNIPAQDEIFWDQVNKKLEPISQGRDALPTVMRAALDEEETAGSSSGLGVIREVAPVGGDASHDPGAQAAGAEGEGGGGDRGRKGVEAEIPLKLKSTTNFGAPFGMA